ncbi:MAG: hypothetical protein JWQ25_891 [Daejeonella sp.]|nr:hypothetical protein [Daejeonella sp.]
MQAKIAIPASPLTHTSVWQQPTGIDNSWFWLKWITAVGFIFSIFLLLIPIAPYLHMDEFMIVDLGRKILNPNSNWAITWMTHRDQPVFVLFYIGPVMQELAFQTMGQYGPRVLGIIGALVSATVIVKWLIIRGTTPNIAFLLGLVFLLDPLFVQSYTMGRVDGWTITCCIASCLCLRKIKQGLFLQKRYVLLIIMAGVFMAIAFLTWPSAVFLFPLLFLELYVLAKSSRAVDGNWKKSINLVALFLISAAVSLLLLLLPVASQIIIQFDNIIAGFKVNTQSGPAGVKSSSQRFIMPSIDLLRNLKYTPILMLTAVVAAFLKKNIQLIFVLGVATLLMLSTVVYIHRVLYLLPYFVACIACLYKGNEDGRASILLKKNALPLLLFWVVALSLIIRFSLAEYKPAERDRSLLYKAGLSMVGKGSHAVFVPFEFYYTGRELGWKMFSPYLSVGQALTSQEMGHILNHVDYAIFEQWRVTPTFANELKKQGMQDKGWYYVYHEYVEKFDGITTNVTRMRNLYSIHRHPYGPYKLFVRTGSRNHL